MERFLRFHLLLSFSDERFGGVFTRRRGLRCRSHCWKLFGQLASFCPRFFEPLDRFCCDRRWRQRVTAGGRPNARANADLFVERATPTLNFAAIEVGRARDERDAESIDRAMPQPRFRTQVA